MVLHDCDARISKHSLKTNLTGILRKPTVEARFRKLGSQNPTCGVESMKADATKSCPVKCFPALVYCATTRSLRSAEAAP